jgi:serine/threonine-protein kinase HipA
MLQLASQVIRSQIAVTGVQPKLSLDIAPDKKETKAKRFTIVGLWGGYILKPQTEYYPHLPEVEDLTMHLATVSKISTVPHSLIRLQSGSLAYITKRIDRNKAGKLHMEDMCQLTERLTEDKYHGSYEKIAKAILQFATNPVLDVINFYEQVVFSLLTGNADMHLKNFSLINIPGEGYSLTPAYDLVATALVNKADEEDTALTLNGKKRKIKKQDFLEAFKRANLEGKVVENIFRKFESASASWPALIQVSYLPELMKEEFLMLVKERFARLELRFSG